MALLEILFLNIREKLSILYKSRVIIKLNGIMQVFLTHDI